MKSGACMAIAVIGALAGGCITAETWEIRVKLDDLMNHGKLKENMPMRPGDVLIIPERVF